MQAVRLDRRNVYQKMRNVICLNMQIPDLTKFVDNIRMMIPELLRQPHQQRHTQLITWIRRRLGTHMSKEIAQVIYLFAMVCQIDHDSIVFFKLPDHGINDVVVIKSSIIISGNNFFLIIRMRCMIVAILIFCK